MARKALKIFVVCAISIAAAGVFTFRYERAIFSVESPDGRHVLTFSHRPLAITPAIRNTYLSIRSDDRILAEPFLIYSGDFLDSRFAEIYPEWRWLPGSVLEIGELPTAAADKLTIVNETAETIDYLLVETEGSKFVVIEVAPNRKCAMNLRYSGRLSFDGRTRNSGSKIQKAVEAKVAGKPLEFKAVVRPEGIEINLTDGRLTETRCCAADRPAS